MLLFYSVEIFVFKGQAGGEGPVGPPGIQVSQAMIIVVNAHFLLSI